MGFLFHLIFSFTFFLLVFISVAGLALYVEFTRFCRESDFDLRIDLDCGL